MQYHVANHDLSLQDFTKQYNRLRQHLAVHSGNADGVPSSIRQSTSVASYPTVNRPKGTVSSRLPASDQLLALAKYSSRLAKIDVPYTMGIGVNRKGPSSYANMKDKSDRATNEQVLDPRTRIILFKMIGRGLIQEVNGCVSTGKEVGIFDRTFSDGSEASSGQCLSRPHASVYASSAEDLQDLNTSVQGSGPVCERRVSFSPRLQP